MRGGLMALLGASVLSTALWASAEVPDLDLRHFEPPTDDDGALYTEPVRTPGHLEWNVGLLASYAERLVVLEDASGAEVAVPVQHQLSLDYAFALGLGERLALGATLPTVLYQEGDSTARFIEGGRKPPKTALGDVALTAKAVLLPAGAVGGFSLGLLGRVTLPSGNGASYVSERAASGQVRLLSELNLVAIHVRATLGARIRGDEVEYAARSFGHELPWGAALVVRPQAFGWDNAGRWQWIAEAHGAVALTPDFAHGATSPAIFGASARYKPSDFSLIAGVELPLGSAVGVPVVRGVIGLGWAPRFYDLDGDGIPDDRDECPELAEDRDGFEDGDGCPDFDNDDDGVTDDVDKCPKQKEDIDQFEDEDGCLDADNDRDGIKDVVDACPSEAGPDSADPKRKGCPQRDRDGDSLLDPNDRCPDEAEDRDGFEDEDGCPDPDDDGDGVPDVEDACPRARGEAREDPKSNGCPSPDRDGDTFDDSVDRCPERAEDFNGVEDGDGCPDADPRQPALVRYDEKSSGLATKSAIAFEKAPHQAEVAIGAQVTLRAIARFLNEHPEAVALVGVRAAGKTQAAEQEALSRGFSLVLALRRLTYRDHAAESVSFSVVAATPGAQASGVGVRILGLTQRALPASSVVPSSARGAARPAREKVRPVP